VISAAALSSDMMMRALKSEASEVRPEDEVRRHAERLREDLDVARKQLAELGEKAYLELTTLGDVERVDTGRVLKEAVESLKLRFPELSIQTELAAGADLLVVGGAASIQRILYNLISNAREGNGKTGASHVTVRSLKDGDSVRLFVEDDGPGFDDRALGSGTSTRSTTKPTGMGLGLVMTSELLRVSGGTLSTDNLPGGGARLCLTLPAASSPS
jgi:signal transduction histidine kinase